MAKVFTKEYLLSLIGQELGESDWLQVDQVMINDFAEVTRDHQHIHVDAEKASLTPFGSTIAHGFLSLSLLSYFAESSFGFMLDSSQMALNYGFDKVRFLIPVKVDSKIRASATLISVDDKRERLLVKLRVVVHIQGEDKPALMADWLIMYMK